ncbi:MAG: SDR family oxidoreductase [Proteobacteria bacterium]|nr:SDR family oxidoreductase [Pseudomonadota bacterium]
MTTLPQLGASLRNRRVLITQSADFMGPALCAAFQSHGAAVIADADELLDPKRPEKLVNDAGQVDVLIANLACLAPSTPAEKVDDTEWDDVFARLVLPLPRLCRAVLPQMLARKSGKIIVMGSASALRGMKRASTYSAARGAQLAYVRALGVEVAPHNVQVNAIAQNFVDNATYFPPQVQALEKFQQRLAAEVPVQRLGTPEEDAMLALFLACDEVRFMVGQSIPFAGGWVT